MEQLQAFQKQVIEKLKFNKHVFNQKPELYRTISANILKPTFNPDTHFTNVIQQSTAYQTAIQVLNPQQQHLFDSKVMEYIQVWQKKAFNGQYAYQYNAIADKILQQSDRLTSSSPHQSTPKPKSTITIATPSQSTTLSQPIPRYSP